MDNLLLWGYPSETVTDFSSFFGENLSQHTYGRTWSCVNATMTFKTMLCRHIYIYIYIYMII